MPRVIHFEVTADDPERAVDFYKNVFGWKIEKWPGPMDYWLVSTGDKETPGIDGGITGRMIGSAHINTVDVPSVEEFAGKIKKAGGELVAPKSTIPGVGYLAYFKDTEGNTFGILQPDSAAA